MMWRLLLSLLFVGVAQAQDVPLSQSTPAQNLQTAQTAMQSAKLALYALSDARQLATFQLLAKVTDGINAKIAALNAQIADYQDAQSRQSAIIAAYQQLYGPLPDPAPIASTP